MQTPESFDSLPLADRLCHVPTGMRLDVLVKPSSTAPPTAERGELSAKIKAMLRSGMSPREVTREVGRGRKAYVYRVAKTIDEGGRE